MKWLSKIKQWFKSEEIYEIEEIILNDDEQLDLQKLQKQGVKITTINESRFYNDTKDAQKINKTEQRPEPPVAPYTQSNELDAKIHYQYPKGEFRFPVIPDHTISERRKKVQPNMVVNIEKTYENPQKVVAINKGSNLHSNSSNANKRPFRPTEIPSPVYGFQQRPRKRKTEQEILEFELEGHNQEASFIEHRFKHNDGFKTPTDEKSVDADIPAYFRKLDQVSNTVPDDVETNYTTDIEGLEKASLDSEIHKREKIQSLLSEDANLSPEEQKSTSNEAISAAEQEQVGKEADATEVIYETHEETATTEVIHETHEETAATEVIHETHEETAATEVIREIHEETTATEVILEIHEETETVATMEQPIVEPAVQETTEQTEIAAPMVEEQRKRKHIPFNVVMLRQDRERLSKQNQVKVEKKTEVIETINPILEPSVSEDEESIENESLPYYQFPTIEYLSPPIQAEQDDDWLDQQGHILNETLHNFNVRAKVVNITQGPAVTQFEIQPEPGVKVNKVTNLSDDLKLCLAAQDIRIEAPIPGKHTIGIEIPNRNSRPVFLREILESSAFIDSKSPLTVALGLDITGKPIVTDLRKMPHGLIAGATGSGKSVCINSMLVSLLYKATPQEVKLLLIDPKMVELAPYNKIPHLVSPVITDVKAATAALKWAVEEMERRYELFAHTGVRDIGRFNDKAKEAGQLADQLPYLVIIIDELADLMMMSPAEVEESICRIAQKARACGIHLLVATQRPSVDVITGLIKANIPTRIAFSVSSQVDSRTILDSAGADKLLGRGDMLFLENGSSKTVRLQGTFVADEEIEEVVGFVRKEQEPQYLFQQEDLLEKAQVADERDELFLEACEFVVHQNGASTSSLQRRFHIGYNRAARLMEILESHGIISEARGSRPREVLMNKEQYYEWVQIQEEK